MPAEQDEARVHAAGSGAADWPVAPSARLPSRLHARRALAVVVARLAALEPQLRSWLSSRPEDDVPQVSVAPPLVQPPPRRPPPPRVVCSAARIATTGLQLPHCGSWCSSTATYNPLCLQSLSSPAAAVYESVQPVRGRLLRGRASPELPPAGRVPRSAGGRPAGEAGGVRRAALRHRHTGGPRLPLCAWDVPTGPGRRPRVGGEEGCLAGSVAMFGSVSGQAQRRWRGGPLHRFVTPCMRGFRVQRHAVMACCDSPPPPRPRAPPTPHPPTPPPTTPPPHPPPTTPPPHPTHPTPTPPPHTLHARRRRAARQRRSSGGASWAAARTRRCCASACHSCWACCCAPPCRLCSPLDRGGTAAWRPCAPRTGAPTR